MRLYIVFILVLAVVFAGSMALAGCDVDEVVWLINEKNYTADDIRKKCKNKIKGDPSMNSKRNTHNHDDIENGNKPDFFNALEPIGDLNP